MAIKPRQELQERADAEPGMVHYLIHGEMSTESGVNKFLNNFPAKIKSAWEKLSDALTKDFIKEHPGARPWAWWRWTSQEPRLRVGGKGSSSHEAMGFAPAFSFGILSSWPKPIDVELELCAINDLPDPDDPPTFESQAVYLQRHGLLTPAEKKWLEKHPEAMEPEAIKV